MTSRMKPWTITGFRITRVHPMHSDAGEAGVQFNIDVDAAPDRVILHRITPDEADRIADEIRAQAAQARRDTQKWQAR